LQQLDRALPFVRNRPYAGHRYRLRQGHNAQRHSQQGRYDQQTQSFGKPMSQLCLVHGKSSFAVCAQAGSNNDAQDMEALYMYKRENGEKDTAWQHDV